MAKPLFRPSMLKVRRRSVMWVIIHHTAEMYDRPEAKIDNTKYQTSQLFAGVMEKKQGDVNYHYIVERVKEDYIAIVTRPYVYVCEWPDISENINNRAVHIGLMGSYDFKIPEKRMYEVLAYRLLNPMMKIFGITPSRIKLHREISDEDTSCPGNFIDKEKIVAAVRRFVIK